MYICLCLCKNAYKWGSITLFNLKQQVKKFILPKPNKNLINIQDCNKNYVLKITLSKNSIYKYFITIKLTKYYNVLLF